MALSTYIRKEINNINCYIKKLEKEQNKSKGSRNSEIVNKKTKKIKPKVGS